MEQNMMKCTAMEDKLADLLLAPEAADSKVKTHVAACESCTNELEELRATMVLLDAWEVPEPTPYFMTRLNARLEDERRAAPAGLLERLRARLMYGRQLHARPIAAVALTVLLLLGGGAYLGVSNWDQTPAPPPQTAVVHDLQLLDNNAQLLDQLESISNNDNDDAAAAN